MFGFDLKSPCATCPFRKDRPGSLRRARVVEILRGLLHKIFACHYTVYAEQKRDTRGRFMHKIRQHCAGALILMHKEGWQGDMQQIAERLGMYDRDELNMDAPVYDSSEAMIEAQE